MPLVVPILAKHLLARTGIAAIPHSLPQPYLTFREVYPTRRMSAMGVEALLMEMERTAPAARGGNVACRAAHIDRTGIRYKEDVL